MSKQKSQVIGVENSTGEQAAGVIERSEMFAVSPAEAVAKAKEDTIRQASAHRIPDQKLLEDKEMAVGRMLDHSVVISNLRKLNSKLLILPGGVEGAVQLRYPTNDQFCDTGTEYITGFYLEPMPEFSSVKLDVKGLPTREIRGWRSVLLALIRKGIIDRVKADALFGLALGQRTDLWYRSLQAQGKN